MHPFGSSCRFRKEWMTTRSRRIEHALVASVRKEHLHGPRRWPRRWSAAAWIVSLLGTQLSRVVLSSSGGVETAVCGHDVRCSWLDDLADSRLLLCSGDFRDGLALRAVSFAIVISPLFSLFSLFPGMLAFAQSSSSSPEPEGRLLIER